MLQNKRVQVDNLINLLISESVEPPTLSYATNVFMYIAKRIYLHRRSSKLKGKLV